jgi:hypothetical protein
LNPSFKGQKVIVLGADQSLDLSKEKDAGVYEIVVKMYLRVRFKLGVIKTRKIKPKITCELRIPLKSAGGGSSAGGGFEATKCDWDR